MSEFGEPAPGGGINTLSLKEPLSVAELGPYWWYRESNLTIGGEPYLMDGVDYATASGITALHYEVATELKLAVDEVKDKARQHLTPAQANGKTRHVILNPVILGKLPSDVAEGLDISAGVSLDRFKEAAREQLPEEKPPVAKRTRKDLGYGQLPDVINMTYVELPD